MKKTVSRLGSAALCVTLSLALGCGCAVMPPASSEKPASSAVSVPTDAEGTTFPRALAPRRCSPLR